jgi:cob(I)alamin adenosyltransferase
MVRLTKIYTRTGDTGTTRLVGGQIVPKEDLRIESYGTIDELNSILGLARDAMTRSSISEEHQGALESFFQATQNNLFNLGSDLATRIEDRWEGMPLINGKDTTALEQYIDTWNSVLTPLESFVLPGGNEVASQLHLARTVCRRAERRIVALGKQEELGKDVIPYVNRLSDTLFVLSRYVIYLCGDDELLWQPRVGETSD